MDMLLNKDKRPFGKDVMNKSDVLFPGKQRLNVLAHYYSRQTLPSK